MKSAIHLILAGTLVALILAAGPFLLIWSLNTLFPALAIPFKFTTWLAVMILGGGFGGIAKVTKK